MSDIVTVNVYGNGVGFVDDYNPSDGQTITIDAYPYAGEDLLDIQVWESHGWSVAVSVVNSQPLTYRSSWGDITIDIYFTGSTPPPPRYWLWAILGSRRRPKTNG